MTMDETPTTPGLQPMPAHLDDALRPIADVVRRPAADLGMVRLRGGRAHGVTWCEIAGRHADGSYLELRLHHRPARLTIQAGLLKYEPLARGGRTVVLGETSHHYAAEPGDVAAFFEIEIKGWLAKLEAP